MDKPAKHSNRALLSDVATRVNTRDRQAPRSVEDGATLESYLSHITSPRAHSASDALIHKPVLERQFWVDPARCRPWAHHNRSLDLLSEERCAELLSGIRAVGRQQRAAIVRTISGESRTLEDGRLHDYEIVSGVRRHWVISWLRARGELNAQGEPYLYLVSIRDDLDTTAAFELSDAENRGQQDISDFERAQEYAWALAEIYDGNATTMAKAIQMERSKLARLIDLAKMPTQIVEAYPSILEIRVRHWRDLGKFFGSGPSSQADAARRILECAADIVDEREKGGKAPADGAATFARLIAASKRKSPGGSRSSVLREWSARATGRTALSAHRTTRGLTLHLPKGSGATKDELEQAVVAAIHDFADLLTPQATSQPPVDMSTTDPKARE